MPVFRDAPVVSFWYPYRADLVHARIAACQAGRYIASVRPWLVLAGRVGSVVALKATGRVGSSWSASTCHQYILVGQMVSTQWPWSLVTGQSTKRYQLRVIGQSIGHSVWALTNFSYRSDRSAGRRWVGSATAGSQFPFLPPPPPPARRLAGDQCSTS